MVTAKVGDMKGEGKGGDNYNSEEGGVVVCVQYVAGKKIF